MHKSVRGRNLRACCKSNNILEESQSQVKTSPQEAVLDTSIQIPHNDMWVCFIACLKNKETDIIMTSWPAHVHFGCSQIRTHHCSGSYHNHHHFSLFPTVSSNIERLNQHIQNTEANDYQAIFSGAFAQFLKFPLSSSDSAVIEKMVSLSATFPPSLESIFSPAFEHNESQFKPVNHSYAVRDDEHPELPQLVSVDSNDGRCTSSDARICNFWDFYISEVASSPFDGDIGFSDITTACQDYEHIQPDITFDKADKYMVLPSLEKTVEISSIRDEKSSEEAVMSSDDSCFYLAIHQMTFNPETENSYKYSDLEEVECFDPQLFLRTFPDLLETNWPSLLPKDTRKRKPITLVLDLDETLVHSTLEHCDDADFTFPVLFNMKEHIVYVRRRPHLQMFLERVSHMFEIVVFTASQSIYAEQLLDILDPDRKLISRRIYRESCIFSDGTYTKDLTILGVDLAKVAIIDNSPQVFRWQVNNGIPIKSWFDDPSDQALISLLPFLETLVNADDVRPIIAKRFGNKV